MSTDQILTGIGLVGIGGLLKSFFDFSVASRKLKKIQILVDMCYCIAVINILAVRLKDDTATRDN